MKKQQGALIDRVAAGSPADIAGIKAGWKLLRVDNKPVGDIIDYKITESDHKLSLLLLSDKGILHRCKISKPVSAPLGLRFNPPTITQMKQCGNNCIFCFIDQNPAGMRSALYVKDDDYRLSFLYGNFITLNRLSLLDLERIESLRLSPLYASVHTTNPELRKRMFKTKRAENGLVNLQRLIERGIQIHAQVVLCPGVNTGYEMERTIEDLYNMGPDLSSVALVPVGLTSHRGHLEALRKFTGKEAEKLLKWLEKKQQIFLEKRGTRFVFAADEFYKLASFPIPDHEQYEGYPQLENGVGLARNFLDELTLTKKEKPEMPEKDLKVTIAAGQAAENLLDALVKEYSGIKGINLELKIIKNSFFGKQVTVSGLLTGSDLLASLKGMVPGDALFISKTMLKEGQDIFLDGLTIKEIERVLNVPVYAVSGPLEFHATINTLATKAILDMKRSSVQ